MELMVTTKKMRDEKDQGGISRRAMLQTMAAATATAALPFSASAATLQEPPPNPKANLDNSAVTAKLIAYMAAAGTAELPDEAQEKTKHHVLDTIAAMVSGVDLPPAKIALKFAEAHAGGEKTATVVGTKITCGAIEAALANGMMAHSDETDDSHAPSHSHPGCSIVPATLAAGEQFGISGSRFLRCVALGYDIGTRVMLTLGGLPYQMETHRSSHNTAANFGSGAAAGCAAGLNEQQMRFILDYSAQQCSATAAWQRDTEHVEKSMVFGGAPARNGVTSAILIQLGATGVLDILSGPDNFLQAFNPKADPTVLVQELGQRFEVTRTNIKKWTVGSPIQAPLDALQDLMEQNHLKADDIKTVNVRVATSEAKTVNDRNMPDISLQHMVAVMLMDGTASFQAAHDEARMKDPRILAQKAKVHLIPDEALEKLYPKRVTVVEVILNDGKQLEKRIDAVKGTAENPMTRKEVVMKANDLMGPYLGAGQSQRLIDSILTLEKVADIRSLRTLLQRG
jgi:2-methylcitrate dehydratase PrpD